MSRHLRSEENHGDEDEQENEQVNEIWYKRYVIVKHDFFECRFIFHETIDIFRDIEDDDNDYQQTYREEESSDIFFEYVPV